MRDFRDAKAMARALRNALKAKGVETTHSESLELIATAFGYAMIGRRAALGNQQLPGDRDHGLSQERRHA